MSRKPNMTLPQRKTYARASNFNVAKPTGRAGLWHQRIDRAREMLRIVERSQAIAGLMGYIDGSYKGGEDELYLNEALPAIEDVVFGTMPQIPPVTVEARQEGQDELAAMAAALIDANIGSGISRAMPTMLQVLWDDITWGVGFLKTAWHSEQVQSNYRPTTDAGAIAADLQEAQAENADPLAASVDSDDDHLIHTTEHERWLIGANPDSPEYRALLAHIAAHYAAIGKRAAWHLIGHLQKNKARRAAAIFDMVETVDSAEIARALDRHAGEMGKRLPVLIEVNSAREPAKSGVLPEAVVGLIGEVANLGHLSVMGLMTMGPLTGDPEALRPCLREVKRLFDGLKECSPPGVEMRYLSMGMTDSYRVAIEEGANLVRIGSGIFGARPPG